MAEDTTEDKPKKRGLKKGAVKASKKVKVPPAYKRPDSVKKGGFNSAEVRAKAIERAHTKEARAKSSATKTLNAEVKRMVQGEVLNAIRDGLTGLDSKGRPFYQKFIQSYLTLAEKDPNSKPAQLLASNLFQLNILEKLDAETDKLISRDVAFSRYRLSQTVFDKQKQVLENRVDKNLCIICSRRAGKTELNARKLLDCALEPNSPCCYIHLTFTNGIAQCYDLVVQLAQTVSLVIKSESKTDGIIEFTNGSVIRFRGNANKQETEKVRGFKYKLVIIDECQSQKNLKYLVNDVVQPLQLDFTNHQLILTGTPPRIPHTFFENAFKGTEFLSYHWDLRDNPYIPNAREVIENLCKEKGLDENSSLIQREYLGMIVYDTDALIFRNYKTYTTLPASFIPTNIYIGVDFGFSDYNAVVALACNTEKKTAYVIEELKFNHATVSEVIDNVVAVYNKSRDFIFEKNKNIDITGAVSVYCDTNEKSIAYELSQTYRLPCYCAYKYDKDMAIEQLAEWCRNGTIFVKDKGIIADEFEQTVHPRDEITDAILSGIDDEVFHPDAVDSLLYASRQFCYDIGGDLGGKGEQL